MELDRAYIKSQAKELIKDRVLQLFLIIAVVALLSGGLYCFFGNIDNFSHLSSNDFGDFPVNNFSTSTIGSAVLKLTSFAAVIFAPLFVALSALLIRYVNGTRYEIKEEFEFVFKNTFDSKYAQKFLLKLLVGIFTFLWGLLLIIPGIVYRYKTYFVDYIMAEYPELSWSETIEVSKKLTNNRKGELLMFDLSFILWFMLMAVTGGLAGIYVLPYYFTAQTLYYENFKSRALLTGEITETDFLNRSQKWQNYAQQAPQQPVRPQAPVQPQAAVRPQTPVQPQPPVQQYRQQAYPAVYQQPVQQYRRPVYPVVYQQPQYSQPVYPVVYQQPVQQYRQPVYPVYQVPVQPVQPQYRQPVYPQYQPPVVPTAAPQPAPPVVPQPEEVIYEPVAAPPEEAYEPAPEQVSQDYTPPAEIKDYYDTFNDNFSE